MTYPLPGERIVATRRRVDFGHHYAPDEPAPDDVLIAYLRVRNAWDHRCCLVRLHDRRNDRESYAAMRGAIEQHADRHNELVQLMQSHRYKSFICDGHRLRLIVEPEGCRREWVDIREVTDHDDRNQAP